MFMNDLSAQYNPANDTPSYFLVDAKTKQRFDSAYTMKGIHAKANNHAGKVIELMRNAEYGFDLLVERG